MLSVLDTTLVSFCALTRCFVLLQDDVVGLANFDSPNTSEVHQSPSLSMTVNTKAAMNVIQQMWESPLPQQRNINSFIHPILNII